MAKRWRKGGQTASPQGRRDDLAARSRRPPTKGERGGELPGGVPVDSNGQTGRRQSATMAPPAANGQRPTARQARHDVDGNSSHLPPPPGPSSLPTNEWAPRLTREAPTSPLPPPPPTPQPAPKPNDGSGGGNSVGGAQNGGGANTRWRRAPARPRSSAWRRRAMQASGPLRHVWIGSLPRSPQRGTVRCEQERGSAGPSAAGPSDGKARVSS